MSGINKVILVGHLGKDPEVRHLEGGVAVASFPLATSETFNKDGRKVEQTEWHNIVMWRGLADVAAKFLQKGKLVYIEGKPIINLLYIRKPRNNLRGFFCSLTQPSPKGRALRRVILLPEGNVLLNSWYTGCVNGSLCRALQICCGYG
jgi:hypothetical protein